MDRSLRVLLIEDSRADAELLLFELRRGGYQPIYERVDTPEAMKEALEKQTWDIILSDYEMPRFSGLAALGIAKEMNLDLPFIIVTGKVGEATAIETLTAGANDYVMKGNMARLVPSVQRVLQDAVLRKERREADEALRKAHEELSLAHAELEKRVEERTVELTKANERLQAEVAERKKAEEQLAQSNQRVNDILTSIQDDFYVLNRDWNFVFASRQFTSRIGKEPKDFVGNNIWTMFPNHLGTVLEENFRAAMDKREIRRFETGGKYTNAWYRMTAFPSTEGITVLGTDMTEQKRAEEALRETEREYRELIQFAPAGIYEIDFRGKRFTSVNDAMCQMVGYSREELLAMNPSELLDEESQLRFQARITKWLSGEAPDQNVEYRVKTKDGRFIEAVLNTTFTTDESGKPLGATVVGHDITERKRAEEALQEAERKYRELVQYAPAAIYEVDIRNKRFTSVNDAMCQVVGYSREELLAMNPFDLLDEESQHRLQIRTAKWLSGEGPDRNVEYRAKTKDGRIIHVVLNVTFTTDENGQPLGAKIVGHDITDRKRAEESLQEAEERLRFALETSHIGAWDLDLTDHTAFRSLEHDHIFGYEHLLPQWTYEMFLEHVLPEDRASVDAKFREATATQSDWSFECRIRRTNGEVRWIWAAGRHRPDAAGGMHRMAGIVQDITERKRAEEEREQLLTRMLDEAEKAKRNRDQLQAVLESMSEAVFIYTRPSELFMTNRAAAKMLGYETVEDLKALEDRVANFPLSYTGEGEVPPEERPAHRAWHGEEISNLEAKVTRKDTGQVWWVSYNGIPIRDDQGRITLVVLTIRDITQQVENRQRLEELAAQMRELNGRLVVTSIQAKESAEEAERRAAELDSILDAMADGVGMYDNEGNTVRMNPAGRRILGLTEEEQRLSAQERANLLHYEKADGTPFEREELPAIKSLHGEIIHDQIMVARRPGRTVWVSTSSVPIRSEDGSIVGSVSSFTDVTERIRSEQFREEYVSLISHDLRNPLTIAMSRADWLSRLLKQRENTQNETENAEIILRSTKRMNAMIQDLVETTRLESGRMEMHKTELDLLPFIAETAEHMGTVQERERIQVQTPNWVPPVQADRDRMERVVTNLMSNALKYSAPNTPVVVQIGRTDGQALVSVSDQGVGIAPDELPHLFERFYRAKATEKTEGLGLGLYISRLIIEAHGGRIWAESEVGKGSTFYFTLPLA